MYTTLHDGIRFVEGRPDDARILGPVEVSIGGALTSAQLKSLDDVKQLLVERAKAAGGNAVVCFRYGQRSVGFWESLFHRDDVGWYGSGLIAVLP